MALAITSRIVSGVVVLDVSGRLCLPEVALRHHIDQLLENGHRGFVLNLADVIPEVLLPNEHTISVIDQ